MRNSKIRIIIFLVGLGENIERFIKFVTKIVRDSLEVRSNYRIILDQSCDFIVPIKQINNNVTMTYNTILMTHVCGSFIRYCVRFQHFAVHSCLILLLLIACGLQ